MVEKGQTIQQLICEMQPRCERYLNKFAYDGEKV